MPSLFAELAQARLNAGPNPPRKFTDWNPVEAAEFESEVAPLAEALGYEHRRKNLAESIDSSTHAHANKPRLSLPVVLNQLPGTSL